LNVADPLVAGAYGKAAFDAVGPLLLIGWAEVGPDLLRALTITLQPNDATSDGVKRMDALFADEPTAVEQTALEPCREDTKRRGASSDGQSSLAASSMVDDDLLERARQADARHWEEHRRPISADTLRRKSASVPPAPDCSSRSSGPIRNNDQLQTRRQPTLRVKSVDRHLEARNIMRRHLATRLSPDGRRAHRPNRQTGS
jgi:hypothetical protein